MNYKRVGHLFQTVIVLYLLVTKSLSSDWDYHADGEDWSEHWAECGASHQSPINVITGIKQCEESLTLDWTSETEYFVVGNNGHALQAVPFLLSEEKGSHLTNIQILNHRNDTKHRLQNIMYPTYKDAVNQEYCLDSIHFHWGETDDYGSEHALNGKFYPLEAHLVHFSCDYYTNTDALSAYSSNSTAQYDDDNILAVISVLFEIGEEGNDGLAQILNDDIVDGIFEYHDPQEALTHHKIELYYTEFDLMNLLPQNKEVILYKGSLTTPPCYETVRWNVMKNTMTVSHDQMQHFRALLQSTDVNRTIAPNYRPLQDATDRIMYECKESVFAPDKDRIEKEVQVEVDECESVEDELKTWRVISIIFICLFGLSLVAIIILTWSIYNRGNEEGTPTSGGRTQKYHKAVTSDDHDAEVEMIEQK